MFKIDFGAGWNDLLSEKYRESKASTVCLMNLDALEYISEDHLVFNPVQIWSRTSHMVKARWLYFSFFDAMFTMRLWMHKFFSLHQGFTGIPGSHVVLVLVERRPSAKIPTKEYRGETRSVHALRLDVMVWCIHDTQLGQLSTKHINVICRIVDPILEGAAKLNQDLRTLSESRQQFSHRELSIYNGCSSIYNNFWSW